MSIGRLRLPRVSPIVIAAAVAIVIALGGGWLWLRGSSLVAIKRVTVIGASGADASQIRSALTLAARDMTTLDVQMSKLRTAVSPFPDVKGLHVSTKFPHGIRITVSEEIPVAVLVAGGRRETVAGDGTLLPDVDPSRSLPTISLRVLPGGTRLTSSAALDAVSVLAAAPYQLLAHVETVTTSASHGVVVALRNGPSLYFGDQLLLGAKWIAAAGVLQNSTSAGASYIDVTDPYRPAAGAQVPPAAGVASETAPGGESSAGPDATSATAQGATSETAQGATSTTALGAASDAAQSATSVDAPGATSATASPDSPAATSDQAATQATGG